MKAGTGRRAPANKRLVKRGNPAATANDTRIAEARSALIETSRKRISAGCHFWMLEKVKNKVADERQRVRALARIFHQHERQADELNKVATDAHLAAFSKHATAVRPARCAAARV